MDIVIDFDGVLSKFDGKWKGHKHFGEPIPDMIKLVRILYDAKHSLRLSTTRLNPHPFRLDGDRDEDVTSGRAKGYIEDWLAEQGILECFDIITGYKPFGHLYIDDRAVRFTGDVRDVMRLIK